MVLKLFGLKRKNQPGKSGTGGPKPAAVARPQAPADVEFEEVPAPGASANAEEVSSQGPWSTPVAAPSAAKGKSAQKGNASRKAPAATRAKKSATRRSAAKGKAKKPAAAKGKKKPTAAKKAKGGKKSPKRR